MDERHLRRRKTQHLNKPLPTHNARNMSDIVQMIKNAKKDIKKNKKMAKECNAVAKILEARVAECVAVMGGERDEALLSNPTKKKTKIDRKVTLSLLPHKAVLRAVAKHTETNEDVVMDVIYDKDTEEFVDRNTRVRYPKLQHANLALSEMRDYEYWPNCWKKFRALNLNTGETRSIEFINDDNWMEDGAEDYCDNDYEF